MRYLMISLTFFVFWTACKSDTAKPIVAQDISGKWDVVSAKRQSKTTGLLNKGFLAFDQDMLKTNLTETGDTTSSRFVLSERKITSDLFSYNVSMLTADSLIVSTKFGKLDFEITLLKSDD